MASPVGRTVAIDHAAFAALGPMARLERCTFDNVCSCIRRSVWIEHPFRATPFAEDLEWARDVLLSGYRLAYAPQALVIHFADQSARYEFARTCALHRRLFELFELRTIPTLPRLARAIASSIVAAPPRPAAGDAGRAGGRHHGTGAGAGGRVASRAVSRRISAAAKRSAARARAFAASTSRSFGGAEVEPVEQLRGRVGDRLDGRSNGSALAFEGLVKPLILRTYCAAAAWISSSVAGGSKL